MPADRTIVTELSTALGMLGYETIAETLRQRPAALATIGEEVLRHLEALAGSGAYTDEFRAGFANGRAFLEAPDALAWRRPRIVEWTGGRRAPGDEVVPSDLRVDHVYLVSCKYLSRILHNPSPARLVEGLLAHGPLDDARDWYQRVAPVEYQDLYETCAGAVPGAPLPAAATELGTAQRRRLVLALRAADGWPDGAADAYSRMSEAVSVATAQMWRDRITSRNAELVLWRVLRIGSAPYFILGSNESGSMRLRIDTPWDWRQAYRLRRFEVTAQPAGQPRVQWLATYETRATAETRTVKGHVEIRWSHGRFGQPPEAKVYLDSDHNEVPGYHRL